MDKTKTLLTWWREKHEEGRVGLGVNTKQSVVEGVSEKAGQAGRGKECEGQV